MPFPKVLIISHNCFSESGSNGRTLSNFFRDYPVDCLAQFYIYNETPHSNVCQNYYRVTDKEAIKSLISFKCGTKLTSEEQMDIQKKNVLDYKKPNRTPLIYYVREWIWSLGHWKNRRLTDWISDFSPNVILFQAGDAAFLYKFALEVAKKRGIPLVIYNSESYYFKETNFLASAFASDLVYKILHKRFCKYAKKAIAYASHSIYITDALKKLYDDEFSRPSSTIMTSSSIVGNTAVMPKVKKQISYLGNLGVGRYETLIELASILQTINSDLAIDIYGKASDDVVDLLNNAKGIRYCGFVSYEQCVRIMSESNILIHVENFSEFYLEDSKYAFSTKIADSLACGTCLFVYAPNELYCTQFLKSNEAACVATNRDEAQKLLRCLISDEMLREKYGEQGKKIAYKKHAIDKNREAFQAIIQEVVNENITS